MSRIQIRYIRKGHYQVTKGGVVAATIERVAPMDHGNWHKSWHWALKHRSGRIDRHATLADAKCDGLKL